MNYNQAAVIDFECNLCGTRNVAPFLSFHREAPNCAGCGSSPRFRGTIHALSMALYGRSIVAKDFPKDKDIKGIGMSDWEGYASILADKFSFQNTYYDVGPKLDITTDDWVHYVDCDFVLCTEVLEHVLHPYTMVPANIKRMLKHDGTLIFSTPYTNRPATKEHFPGLTNYVTTQLNGQWIVIGTDPAGNYLVFDKDICFHGGPGSVLELRVFSEREIMALLFDAGFQLQAYDQVIPEVGYAWPSYEERTGDGIGLNYIIAAKPHRY